MFAIQARRAGTKISPARDSFQSQQSREGWVHKATQSSAGGAAPHSSFVHHEERPPCYKLPETVRMGALLSLIAHTELFFPLLLVGLLLVVEAGFRVRRASPGVDPEIQSAVESARDRLTVLLALLLGFSLPMALPHYEQRNQLVTDEADAISTVAQRAQILSEPYRERILQALGEYIDARLEFASADLGGPQMMAAVNHAKHLQNEMWLQSVPLIPQTPMFAQSVDRLSDLIEERLAAAERRIPDAIWLVFILISVLACFVVGYSMRCRVLLGMLVLPLTVAIVLSLVSELDNPHAGVIRVSQKSMLRIQQDLKAQAVPGR